MMTFLFGAACYLEISKPNLRNNLKQLLAMKNSILILCLLFTGVTFSQGLPRTHASVILGRFELYRYHTLLLLIDLIFNVW